MGTHGLRLIEYRPASAKDFFVTHEDYQAVVAALQQTTRPNVRFDPLHEAYLKAGGTKVKSAYPLRVVLRFLRSLQPPLITGQRGYYTLPMAEAEFKKKAHEAWDALEKRGA